MSYLTPKNLSLLYIAKTHVLQKCTLFTQFMSCKIIETQVSYILIFSMNVPCQKGFGRGLSVERMVDYLLEHVCDREPGLYHLAAVPMLVVLE